MKDMKIHEGLVTAVRSARLERHGGILISPELADLPAILEFRACQGSYERPLIPGARLG